jgi:hypothetical protein
LGLDAALPRVAAFTQSLRAVRAQAQAQATAAAAAAAAAEEGGGVCGCDCHCHGDGGVGLYFAAVDVERCYDHIRPQLLLTLLRGALCVCVVCVWCGMWCGGVWGAVCVCVV